MYRSEKICHNQQVLEVLPTFNINAFLDNLKINFYEYGVM